MKKFLSKSLRFGQNLNFCNLKQIVFLSGQLLFRPPTRRALNPFLGLPGCTCCPRLLPSPRAFVPGRGGVRRAPPSAVGPVFGCAPQRRGAAAGCGRSAPADATALCQPWSRPPFPPATKPDRGGATPEHRCRPEERKPATGRSPENQNSGQLKLKLPRGLPPPAGKVLYLMFPGVPDFRSGPPL